MRIAHAGELNKPSEIRHCADVRGQSLTAKNYYPRWARGNKSHRLIVHHVSKTFPKDIYSIIGEIRQLITIPSEELTQDGLKHYARILLIDTRPLPIVIAAATVRRFEWLHSFCKSELMLA